MDDVTRAFSVMDLAITDADWPKKSPDPLRSMDGKTMVWTWARRAAAWTMLVMASTSLAGCAALELLEGHLPGQEPEPAPIVDPQPYPAPRSSIAHRPQSAAEQNSTARTTDAAAAPAPVVATASAPKAPAKESSQSPARASLSDEASDSTPKASSASAASATPPVTAASAVPAAGAKPAPAASQAPAGGAAASVPPSENKSKPAGDQAATTKDSSAGDKASEQKQPTPEQRLADILRRRDELLKALETEVALRRGKNERDEELPRMQQQLRLLYLLAERPDDAVGEIESLPAAEQEAFKQLMFGLSTWLSQEEERRPNLRNARVLRSLKDASGQLSAAAKLDVRNLRFCESVEGFGWYKEFPTAQFRPKQQLILYAEVENFATEKKSPDTYETEFQASYQIFDAGGTLVDERQLALDKEVCRNQRRDYFLAYRVYLPEGIGPGRYRLELTVEDLKAKEHYQGRKLGDGVIEFSIR